MSTPPWPQPILFGQQGLSWKGCAAMPAARHRNLIMMSLDFGLENLTPEELADFANNEWPCESRDHSPKNLHKLRSRIPTALDGNATRRRVRYLSRPVGSAIECPLKSR